MGFKLDQFSHKLQKEIRGILNAQDSARSKRICPAVSKQVPVQALVHSPKGEVETVGNTQKRYKVSVLMHRVRLIDDEENLQYSCKELFDGLVEYGMIPDDSREVIDRDIQQVKVKTLDVKTVITIMEL